MPDQTAMNTRRRVTGRPVRETMWMAAAPARARPPFAIMWRHQETAMAITIYGIKNCDTMKKARAWLDKAGVDYAFHDYKTAGIAKDKLESWAKKASWEAVINRAGLTFKKLPDKDKENLTEAKAIKLMLAQPSMIKRPVLELPGGKVLVGFKPEAYEAALG
jgi:arsenate reductase